MKKINLNFIEFMNNQKQIYNIPDCDNGNYLEMAMKYSLNNNYHIQPDYYTSLYYIVMYAVTSIDINGDIVLKNHLNNTDFNIYRTTGLNEEVMYEHAYNAFCNGRTNELAEKLMKPLIEMEHIEALYLYEYILIALYGSNIDSEYKNKRRTIFNNMNILDVIGLCFEQYPFALEKLDQALVVGGSCYPEIEKNQSLQKIVREWLTVINNARISKNKNDGYAMNNLYNIYDFGPIANDGYKNYWKNEALNIQYPPTENLIAQNIVFNPVSSFNIDFDTALKYAKNARDAGYYNAKETVKNIKDYKKKQEKIQGEIHTMNQNYVNSQVEAQMQQYRDKLDRQEIFINGLSHGAYFTNEEEKIYSWMNQDYDNYSTNYILRQMREEKERKYRDKLTQDLSDKETYHNHISYSHINTESIKPNYKNTDQMFFSNMEQYHLNNLYDEIIINQNMLSTKQDIEKFISDSSFQKEMRNKAKYYFENLVNIGMESNICKMNSTSSCEFRKNVFTKCGDRITILDNGNELEFYSFNKSQFDAQEKKEIKNLKNIKQVQIFKYGLLAIDAYHQLIYIGKNSLLKNDSSKINNAREIIKLNEKTIYCLKDDGEIIKINNDGFSSIAFNIKKIMNYYIDYADKIVSIRNSGELEIEDIYFSNVEETFTNVLDAQVEYSKTGLKGKQILGICKDGSLLFIGDAFIPKEILEINGIVSIINTYARNDKYTCKIIRYNNEEIEFKW